MYKCTWYSRDSIKMEFYFNAGDLSKINKDIRAKLIKEMVAYYCDGCYWCCYRSKPAEYKCTRRFVADPDKVVAELLEYEQLIATEISFTVSRDTFVPAEIGFEKKEESVATTLKEFLETGLDITTLDEE